MHADYLGANFRNRGILGAKSGRCGHEVHRRCRLGRCSLRRILHAAIVSTGLSRVAGFALAREGGLVARAMVAVGIIGADPCIARGTAVVGITSALASGARTMTRAIFRAFMFVFFRQIAFWWNGHSFDSPDFHVSRSRAKYHN